VTARDFSICLFFTSSTSATAVPHQCFRVGEEGDKEEGSKREGGVEGMSKRERGRKREGEEDGRETRKRGRQ
jgi:hypothetical protein